MAYDPSTQSDDSSDTSTPAVNNTPNALETKLGAVLGAFGQDSSLATSVASKIRALNPGKSDDDLASNLAQTLPTVLAAATKTPEIRSTIDPNQLQNAQDKVNQMRQAALPELQNRQRSTLGSITNFSIMGVNDPVKATDDYNQQPLLATNQAQAALDATKAARTSDLEAVGKDFNNQQSKYVAQVQSELAKQAGFETTEKGLATYTATQLSDPNSLVSRTLNLGVSSVLLAHGADPKFVVSLQHLSGAQAKDAADKWLDQNVKGTNADANKASAQASIAAAAASNMQTAISGIKYRMMQSQADEDNGSPSAQPNAPISTGGSDTSKSVAPPNLGTTSAAAGGTPQPGSPASAQGGPTQPTVQAPTTPGASLTGGSNAQPSSGVQADPQGENLKQQAAAEAADRTVNPIDSHKRAHTDIAPFMNDVASPSKVAAQQSNIDIMKGLSDEQVARTTQMGLLQELLATAEKLPSFTAGSSYAQELATRVEPVRQTFRKIRDQVIASGQSRSDASLATLAGSIPDFTTMDKGAIITNLQTLIGNVQKRQQTADALTSDAGHIRDSQPGKTYAEQKSFAWIDPNTHETKNIETFGNIQHSKQEKYKFYQFTQGAKNKGYQVLPVDEK